MSQAPRSPESDAKKAAPYAPKPYEPELRRESVVSAALQVAVVLGATVGALYMYNEHVTEKKRVHDLANKAAEARLGDDAPSLLEAKKLYEEIFAKDGSAVSCAEMGDARVVSNLAEIDAQLYALYGMTALRADAETCLAKSKELKAERAERYAAEAYLLLGQGKAAEAETLMRDTLKRGGRDGRVFHGLSMALLAEGRAEEAARAAEEGLKISANLPRLPISQAEAMLAQGNTAGARDAFNRALRINGDHARARAGVVLADVASRNGKPALWLRELDKIKTSLGEDAPPRSKAFLAYVRGEVLLFEGKFDDALKAADEAATADASMYQSKALKGRVLARQGKVADAKNAFREALQAAPGALTVAELGYASLKLAGKPEEGISLLESVNQASPESRDGYAVLAQAYFDVGQAEKAKPLIAECEKRFGGGHEAVLFLKGRDLAATDMEKATEKYVEASGAAGAPWGAITMVLGEGFMSGKKDLEQAKTQFDEAAKLFMTEGAPVEVVAYALRRSADATEAMGGRKNAKLAEETRERVTRLLGLPTK